METTTPPQPDADALFAVVYDELRRLARHHLRQERPDHTLQPTALVHEAYVRLARQEGFASRAHFLAVASRAMRHVLVDHARARLAARRGGGAAHVTLDPTRLAPLAPDDPDQTAAFRLAVDDALGRLERRDAAMARLVELRFFGGLEVDEAALALDISPRTAARLWARAKAHLRADLGVA